MTKCPICGYENPKENTTCTYCGSSLFNERSNNNPFDKPRNMAVSIILAIFLPGISYFYLKQWYKGLYLILLFPILMFVYPFVGGMYISIYPISISLITGLLLITYLLLYLLQIYDIIQQTKILNNVYFGIQ